MGDVVSAIPDELLDWSDWTTGSDRTLEAAGRALAGALQEVMATPAFGLMRPPMGGDVAPGLVAYAVRNSVNDAWVGRVGRALRKFLEPGLEGPDLGVTVPADKLAALVGSDPVAQAADEAAGAELGVEVALRKGSGVDPKVLAELKGKDQAFLQGFLGSMGADFPRAFAYLRALPLSASEQLTLVKTTPLLTYLRRHPDAARDAGLLQLDWALFRPGGLLYKQSGGSWSPYANLRPGSVEAWDRAVGFLGICTVGGATYFYGGGGFIIGPDGREYPLVDPTVNQGGKSYQGDAPFSSGDIDDLDGRDGGWQTLYSLNGVDSFGPAPSGWDRFCAFWAGTAGADPAPNENALQSFVNVTAGGYPSLGSGPTVPSTPAAPPTMYDQRLRWMPVGNGQWAWVDMDKYQPSRTLQRQYPAVFKPPEPGTTEAEEQEQIEQEDAALGGAAGLAPITLEGIADAATLGNPNLRYYSVVFQQNPDGRVRAILRTYRVIAGQDESGQPFYRILPYDTSIGPGGTLQDVPMTFRQPTKPPPPEIGPVMPPVIVGSGN